MTDAFAMANDVLLTAVKGIAEIIIAKQRNGPIGTVELSWQPSLTRFANLAR